MKKQNQNIISKKGSVSDDIEKLKLRREDRKIKNNEERNSEKKIEDNGKACDAYYENLMKKKKIAFNIEPEKVNFLPNYINLLFCITRIRIII